MDSNSESLPEILHYEQVLKQEKPKLVRYIAKEKHSDGSFRNLTVHRWISLLTQSNPDYSQRAITQFSNILRDSDMKAFFFETKGVNYRSSKETFFEFVLIECNYLYQFADAQQDGSDFGDLLTNYGDSVGVVFPNLGGDSVLVAPTPMDQTNTNVYGHLGAFLRRAPVEQVVPFWKLSIDTLRQQLETNPSQTYWFSTDGTGVRWLHMRIDPRPKYYDYEPFKEERGGVGTFIPKIINVGR